LPFSDSSIGIPPVSGKRKPWNSVPNHFSEEKYPQFRSESFLRREKPSDFSSKPFLGREKPSEFRSEPFLDEKYLKILFRTIFGRKKTSEFHTESFLEEQNFGIPL
jgi:hypothetical protein